MLRCVLLSLLGLAAGLLAAEGFTRAVCPGLNWTPKVGISTSALAMTPGGFHRMKSDLRTEVRAGWITPVAIFTDDRGYRIPAASYPRPAPGPDVEEIFVIGASYTFGLGMEAELTWPFVFEQRLADTTRPLRVTNAAQAGYALPHMLSVLEDLLGQEELPDRIFSVMPMTGLYILGLGAEAADFEVVNESANGLVLGDARFDEDFAYPQLEVVDGWLMRADRPYKHTPLDVLRTTSAVAHRAIVRFDNYRAPLKVVQRTRARDEEKLMRASTRIGQRLRALAERFRARRVPIHSILIPADWDVYREKIEDEHVRYVRAFAREAGLATGLIDLVDLAGQGPWHVDLDASVGGDYLSHDEHYSARGHAKIADTLVRWYRTKERVRPERIR